MKRIFTSIAVILCFSMASHAQYYFNTNLTAGQNPGGVNTDAEQPFGAVGVTAADGYASIIANGTATLSWSPVQTLPFPFSFNGTPVTQYKVSNSGVLTFTTTATTVPPFANATLPNASIPDMSVMVWGLQQAAGGSANDGVLNKTHGTAPNRQHWVNFASFGAPGASGQQWTYWGIVLEETTNNMYIVDLRTFNTPLSLTIGVQIDASNAVQVATAPNTPSVVTNGGSASDPSDNAFYEFIQGNRPTDEVELTSLDVDELVLTGGQTVIQGTITNKGSNALTSYTLSWTVDGGTNVNSQVISTMLAPTSTTSFSHSVNWTPARGDYELEVYTSLPNNNPDPNPLNDTIITDVNARTFVTRNVLLEEFTTAPCQFCPDGAVVVEQILAANPNVIGVGEHACFSTDAMTIPEASTYCSAFGSGAPTACIDRVLFPGETNVAHSRGAWQGNADDRSNIGAFVDVDVTGTYDNVTRQASVNINAQLVDSIASGDVRVTLFVVEDHVRGTGNGYNQVNAYNTVAGHPYTGAGNPIVNYDHRHVLRDVYPTTNAWGEAGVIPTNPVLNTTYTKNYNVAISNAWNADSVYIIGFVNYFSGITSQREILNAFQVKLSNLITGIEDVQSEVKSLKVYPNPSNSLTNIELNLNTSNRVVLSVFDITGKKMIYTDYGTMVKGQQKMQIDVSALPNGFYFVNMAIGNEIITKKISVINE